MTQINLLPFIVEALGYNKSIYKDIDQLYQKHRYKFYKSAKEHELYNHQIVKEGSLLQEEYCKKALGILLNIDDKIGVELGNIIRKGWTYTYLYVQNHSQIDMEKYMQSFIKKHKGINNLNDDDLNTNLVILVFIALNSEKSILENELHFEFQNLMLQRMEHYNDDCLSRITYNKISKEDMQRVKQLQDGIYSQYGIIKDIQTMFSNNPLQKYMDRLGLLFDYEKMSSASMFNDIEFSNRDIEEILYLYIIQNDSINVEVAAKYLINCIYIKYLIKAYKQVKGHYFRNNKETTYIELEGLEKELATTRAELQQKNNTIQELQEQLEQKEKEMTRLNKELVIEKENRSELNSLREFMFSADKQTEYAKELPDLLALTSINGLIVGGHNTWQMRMREMLPHFKFLSVDNINFDVNILKGVDIVFIYTNYLSHKLYYKVMNELKQNNIKIEYLAYNTNENIVLQQIFNKSNE